MQLRKEIKDLAMEGMKREMVCQIISRERLVNRIRLLALYPDMIWPYLMRIRWPKQ